MKRAIDLAVSGIGLVLLSPVLAVVAGLIKRSEPEAPVLFTQERVGLGGEPFDIHKFRTMRAGAGGLQVTSDGDDRITRVGRVLRKTKLDELPQLWDVARGRMSLVGPRPEVSKYVAQWPAELRDEILSVRPGITDPASIRFRNESEELAAAADPEAHYVHVILPEKARMYAAYARSHSLRGDLKVLWDTLVVVARR
ncbi:MAG TPA: sugar transferase [Phycicoccus sp.]|jgi:lipopolysaccharide/colanic/teichoic acid biosynthesis glycosyltransferase|nr:sugar transferase [Phycicoccus sp.]HQH06975.1 sugar transferase [Phycicoccus sp.]HQV91770.1 sugar transferase [Phycicoccus sp.]HQY96082.1 sugar transferase [Phycicoccus sp.]HRA44440.1 sugar transferase [Phycicoccus sp.]